MAKEMDETGKQPNYFSRLPSIACQLSPDDIKLDAHRHYICAGLIFPNIVLSTLNVLLCFPENVFVQSGNIFVENSPDLKES